MEINFEQEKLAKYDRQNMINLLEKDNLERLKMFCKVKQKQEILNLGTIYYLFSKYWPKQLAEELKANKLRDCQNKNDAEIIEDENPIKYLTGKRYDWKGISKTILTLENVRQKLIKTIDKKETSNKV